MLGAESCQRMNRRHVGKEVFGVAKKIFGMSWVRCSPHEYINFKTSWGLRAVRFRCQHDIIVDADHYPGSASVSSSKSVETNSLYPPSGFNSPRVQRVHIKVGVPFLAEMLHKARVPS